MVMLCYDNCYDLWVMSLRPAARGGLFSLMQAIYLWLLCLQQVFILCILTDRPFLCLNDNAASFRRCFHCGHCGHLIMLWHGAAISILIAFLWLTRCQPANGHWISMYTVWWKMPPYTENISKIKHYFHRHIGQCLSKWACARATGRARSIPGLRPRGRFVNFTSILLRSCRVVFANMLLHTDALESTV